MLSYGANKKFLYYLGSWSQMVLFKFFTYIAYHIFIIANEECCNLFVKAFANWDTWSLWYVWLQNGSRIVSFYAVCIKFLNTVGLMLYNVMNYNDVTSTSAKNLRVSIECTNGFCLVVALIIKRQ